MNEKPRLESKLEQASKKQDMKVWNMNYVVWHDNICGCGDIYNCKSGYEPPEDYYCEIERLIAEVERLKGENEVLRKAKAPYSSALLELGHEIDELESKLEQVTFDRDKYIGMWRTQCKIVESLEKELGGVDK